MLPPPPATYNSVNELLKNVQAFANSQSYMLVKKRTHKDRQSNELQPLLQALQERYEEWPEHQQATIRKKLNSIINTSTTILQRGRPPVHLIVEQIIQPEEILLGLS
ncbi:21890_t:CDS:2 [Dentiscutata erythropus]|uniref:21890_t:CDS:1 n=1 Tax=Dentiscutata erythropus TaxID=1348616 RepID=A0A9N9JDE2_9GLOM|nr:21890_t:CDS:2 [Dentiscutata erythropus]